MNDSIQKSDRSDVLHVAIIANRSVLTITALTCLFSSATVMAWPATVDHVADGDTVTVIRDSDHQRYRVRVADVDAPETAHGSNRPGQPYGLQATNALKGIIGSSSIDVRPTGAKSYDRIVASLFVNGQDAAALMVRSGYAWDSPKYDTSHRYTNAQAKARVEKRGLWAQADPVAPWEWRANRWR